MRLSRTASIVLLVLTAGPLALQASAKTNLNFRHQELEADFDVGYAVLTADVNHDGRLAARGRISHFRRRRKPMAAETRGEPAGLAAQNCAFAANQNRNCPDPR